MRKVRAFGVLIAAAFLAPTFGARAEEAPSPCANHKWSIDREALLLAYPKEEAGAGAGGAEWSAAEDGAFLLALRPLADVIFEKSPERPPANRVSYGSIVRLTGLDSALFEISLSDAAWIDVLQNGAFVKAEDFSGAEGCAVRKSVRFRLEAGQAVLQLSGAAAPSIGVAVMRVAE